MEYTAFKDRNEELAQMKSWFIEQKSKLVILYGRRRVGKTELLRQFAEKHPSLYLLARQESQNDQIKHLSIQIADFFNDELVRVNPLLSWDAIFTYLIEKAVNIPIFIDEFPYLVQTNKALPSILQDYWDNQFSKINAFIVLCGSSIAMMESLLGYKSPLYGRRTGQILLEPLGFFDAQLFFPLLSAKQKVEFFAILGGTPAYLIEFDEEKDWQENIKEKVLQKNSFLAQDVLYVLREELSEPRYYFSILQSISRGNTSIGRIVNDTGLEKGLVMKYVSVLIDLHILERRIPVTEMHPEKSRRGIYVLKDNFFKFWFRFIFTNSQYIEQGLHDKLLREKIIPEFNSFVGRAFEDICLEWMRRTRKNFIIGRWWDRQHEIDIVGIDASTSMTIFGSVKWSDLKSSEARTIITSLQKDSMFVDTGCENVEYFLIARSIDDKDRLTSMNVHVFDLNDLVNM